MSMDYFFLPGNKLDLPLVKKLVELGNTDEYKQWAALWKAVQEIERENGL